VDDDPGIVEVLRDYLMKEHYEVVSAGCVESARHQLQADEFDAAIVDVKLPGESGLTLLEEAQMIDQRMRVIIMTAVSDIEVVLDASRKADGYMQKPFSLYSLGRLLDELLSPAESAGSPADKLAA
jgi:two-component system response regulator PilR (NtrC family)